jgi:hypothetical protein
LVISSGPGIKIKKYWIAAELFQLLRKRPRFVILSGLDFSLVTVTLFFDRNNTFFLSRSKQWYQLRQKTPRDIFGGALKAQTAEYGADRQPLKRAIRKLFRLFVMVSPIREGEFETEVLLIDNGYTEVEHIRSAFLDINRVFINPSVTFLTFNERQSSFSDLAAHQRQVIIKPASFKYRLTVSLFSLGQRRYKYIILTTLDVSPLAVSLLFLKGRILLFNRWNQWWSVSLRGVGSYIRSILRFFYSIITFIFLVICSTLIFLQFYIRLAFNRMNVFNSQEESL